MHRLPRFLLLALLVWVAAVSAVRAVDLARRGWFPSAPDEVRWFRWAGGGPRERALEAALRRGSLVREARAEPGRDLVLEVAGGRVRSDWLQVRAQYAWPSVQVVGVVGGDSGEPRRPAGVSPGARVLRLAVPLSNASTPDAPLPDATPPGASLPEAEPEAAAPAGLGSLAGGLLLAFAAGWALLRALGAHPGLRRQGALVLAAGLAVLAPGLWGLGLVGAAPRAAVALLAVLTAGAAGAAEVWRRRSPAAREANRRVPGREGGVAAGRWERAAEAVLAGVLLLFVWKVALAPLWSWDHFAIWGVKARRLAAVGLGPEALATPGLRYAALHYPLGLPAVWLVLSLGGVPGMGFFKAAHAVFGITTVLLVHAAIRRSGGGRLAAATLAAAVAASPLLWDTVSMGLADLPLALWATAAVVAGLEGTAAEGGRRRRRPYGCLPGLPQGLPAEPPCDSPAEPVCRGDACVARFGGRSNPLLLAGLLLGFLPWIKQEGLVLAVLLGLALFGLPAVSGHLSGTVTGDRRGWLRRALYLGLPLLGMLAARAVVQHARAGEGRGFFTGDWPGRMAARAADLPALLGRLLTDLAGPQWLGLWVLFAAGCVWAATRRRWRPLVLAAAVAAQLGVYALVYLGTHLAPAAHIDSSFLRIAAALLPLAAVALGGALAEPPPRSAFDTLSDDDEPNPPFST